MVLYKIKILILATGIHMYISKFEQNYTETNVWIFLYYIQIINIMSLNSKCSPQMLIMFRYLLLVFISK